MTSITPLDSTPSFSAITPARSVGANDASAVARSSTPAPATTGGAAGSFATSIDPALGITVLKFFSSAGDLTHSFPSQKQLASYQVYGLDKGSTTPSAASTSGDAATGSTASGATPGAVVPGATAATPGVASARVASPAPVPVSTPVAATGPGTTAAAPAPQQTAVAA